MNDIKKNAAKDRLRLDCVPISAVMEAALAFSEGAIKYGRFGWRSEAIDASTYYAAILRHIGFWIEGENIDPDSGISHLSKAVAGLMILRDAELHGQLIDDRPPYRCGFPEELRQQQRELMEKLRYEQ